MKSSNLTKRSLVPLAISRHGSDTMQTAQNRSAMDSRRDLLVTSRPFGIEETQQATSLRGDYICRSDTRQNGGYLVAITGIAFPESLLPCRVFHPDHERSCRHGEGH